MNVFGKRNNILFLVSLLVLTFTGMFLFFTIAHPLYIYDMDDWAYVNNARHAWPSMSQWNPTRILPETLMPFVSFLGAFVLYPASGDYIQALAYSFAVFVSAFISIYVMVIGIILKKDYSISNKPLLMIMILFLLSHFYAYLTQDENNAYVLYGGNVTCVFYYLIPALWNFIVCCFFIIQGERQIFSKENYVKSGCLILAVYLAINSNLWHSIIFTSYLGIDLLYKLGGGFTAEIHAKPPISCKKKIAILFKKELSKVIILFTWFLSMIFEVNGGRAKWNVPAKLQLAEALKCFVESLSSMNTVFLIAVITINTLAVIIACLKITVNYESRKFLVMQGKSLATMTLTIIYLVLLAAKAAPHYLKNANVMISWMLWLLLITVSSTAYIVKSKPCIIYFLPLTIYILVFEVMVEKKTFAENYASSQAPAVIKALDDDIIAQVKEAEEMGESSVIVYFPVTDTGNWPRNPSAMAHRISDALYYHGVTETHMEIEIRTDLNKDSEFHLR